MVAFGNASSNPTADRMITSNYTTQVFIYYKPSHVCNMETQSAASSESRVQNVGSDKTLAFCMTE